MPYTIETHKHRFAAWAASRAASVKGCRFTVEQGKAILETIGINHILSQPDNLPQPQDFDPTHREWRNKVIYVAQELGLKFTHGVAAKLINIYLKAGFVCAGQHDNPRVQTIHPPIDSLLLDELFRQNLGGFRSEWNTARRIRWSNLDSEQYDNVICHIRLAMQPEQALWKS
jgi:hypothetical protein